MRDEDKTREELIGEIQALRKGLGPVAARPEQQSLGDAPWLDGRHRAVTEDQRLVSRCLSDGTLTFVSDAYCRYFGKARDELLGASFLPFVPEAERDRLRTHIGSLGPVNPIGILEHRVIRSDGEMCWHLRVDQVLLGVRDTVAEIESVARDVTDQRHAMAELRRRDATLRAFFEAATEGIVGVDRDGRIVLANARIESMFGYRREDLLGKSVELLVPDRSRQLHAQERVHYFAQPRTRSMGLGVNLAGRRKDGTEFPIEVSLSFVPNEEGGVAMAFITDITGRMALERSARQADKLAALGTLAAGLAHELNNPIGIISSRIELMLLDAESQPLPQEVTEDLRVLHRHAQRVARIAQGLLSFARQSSGQRGPVDLNHLVEETLLLIEEQMTKAQITVRRLLTPDLPPVWGDGNALQQVMLNLLTNARDALAEGGEIAVETGPAPGQPGGVRLIVSDTGPGVPPEVLPRIFDPFFTTKSEGTGLGLSISYGIVRDHKGMVDVQSRAGEGTTFILTFPPLAAEVGA